MIGWRVGACWCMLVHVGACWCVRVDVCTFSHPRTRTTTTTTATTTSTAQRMTTTHTNHYRSIPFTPPPCPSPPAYCTDKLIVRGTIIYYDDVSVVKEGGGELKAHAELTTKYNIEWRKLHDSCWEVLSVNGCTD